MVTNISARKEFIPNGPAGSMDERRVMPASSMIVLGDRILFLYMANSAWPKKPEDLETYGCLATLRLDGFVAMTADAGYLVTKPLVIEADELYINACCEEQGSISIEITDANNKPITGFTRAEAEPITGDHIHWQAKWKEYSDLGSLMGQTVRLKFYMNDCKLYSFYLN